MQMHRQVQTHTHALTYMHTHTHTGEQQAVCRAVLLELLDQAAVEVLQPVPFINNNVLPAAWDR